MVLCGDMPPVSYLKSPFCPDNNTSSLAHKLDLDKAEEQFKVSTSWKLENELDGMYENFIGSDGLSYSDGSAFGGTSREAKLGAKVYYGGILAAKTVNGGPIMVRTLNSEMCR